MKNSKLILVMSLFTAFIYLASCSKKNTPKPATTSGAVGYWFGTANAGAFNQSLLLRADGSVKVYDFYANPTSTDTTIAYDGTGSWSANGNIVAITTSFPNGQTFSSTALLNLNATPPTLTGTGTSGYNGDVYKKQ